MADQYTQDIAFNGSPDNMVPATYISRLAQTADIEFGVPVKQGTDPDQCVTGSAADQSFLGVSVREFGLPKFPVGTEVRIMTQGTIWVTAKTGVTITAGQPVVYDAGWTNTGLSKDTITNARYETAATGGNLVAIRLGTPVAGATAAS